MAPVAADIMLAGEMVSGHQVRAKQKAVRVTANQGPDRRVMCRHFAHLPLGRARIKAKIGIALEERVEVIRMLGITAHMGANPGKVGEKLKQALEPGILIQLGAELGSVLVWC